MIPKKILVCTDFSENSVPARILAIEYAKVFNSELIILHIVNSRLIGYPLFDSTFSAEMSVLQDHIMAGVDEELELIGNDCKRDVDEVKTYCRTGAPAEEIVRFANEEEVGLIVMGTHGWTGAKHLILGSTAENVVRHADCPVLTVRSSFSS